MTKKGVEGSLNFLCYDFTTDLSSSEQPGRGREGDRDRGTGSHLKESVIAKFRATKDLDLIRICNSATVSNTSQTVAEISSPLPFPHQRIHLDLNLSSDHESMTPQPRVLKPKPENIIKIERSDPIQEEAKEEPSFASQQRQSQDDVGRLPIEGRETRDLPLHSARSPSVSERSEFVPKELFLRQQEMIFSLQEQVQLLQREISSLQNRLSHSLNVTPETVAPPPHPPQFPSFLERREMSEREAESEQEQEEEEEDEANQPLYRPDPFPPPSYDVSEEQEEESFICRDPFEKCEMEAPSIFNFDLFVRTLKERNGESVLSLSLLIPISFFSSRRSISHFRFSAA
jgi:hypothetical protein